MRWFGFHGFVVVGDNTICWLMTAHGDIAYDVGTPTDDGRFLHYTWEVQAARFNATSLIAGLSIALNLNQDLGRAIGADYIPAKELLERSYKFATTAR